MRLHKVLSTVNIEFGVYAGVPAKKAGKRKKDLLELEKRFLI